MTKVKYDPILDALREDDTGTGGGGGDDDANELIAATPFTTTTMPEPIQGGGDMTVMEWPDSRTAIAMAIAGDDFPRLIISPDPNEGIFFGDGTVDPYNTGPSGSIEYNTTSSILEFSATELSINSGGPQLQINLSGSGSTEISNGGLYVRGTSQPISLNDGVSGRHDLTVDSVPNLLNDGNAVGIQPATNPTAITDIANGPHHSGTMRFVQFDGDDAVLAIGQEGDTYPQWLWTSNAGDGLYMSDGSFDPFNDGPEFYYVPINVVSGQDEQGMGIFPNLTLGNLGGGHGLYMGGTSSYHKLTVDDTPQLLLDGSPIAGGGSGITRTVTVTSAGFTAGNTASTDYVYLIAGAHTPTMPAAASNKDRYTFKNNHSANVTVTAGGTDTVEGVASYSLAPGESIDLISDNTSNWNII